MISVEPAAPSEAPDCDPFLPEIAERAESIDEFRGAPFTPSAFADVPAIAGARPGEAALEGFVLIVGLGGRGISSEEAIGL